jgi:small subunit ribosomal protein S3Ae
MATQQTTQKKVVDNWKAKSWYTLISPKFLGETQFAEVPSLDEDHLINRIIAMPLKEITRDISHMYITIRLRVSEIKGKTAFTKFIGHSIAREYMSTLIRRYRDGLQVIFPVVSKDGVEFTVKALVVTANACSKVQKHSLRRVAHEELKADIAATNFGDFMLSVLNSKASTKLYNKLKKISPLKRVEIYKTELKEVFDVQEIIKLDRQVEEDKVKAAEAEKKEEPVAELAAQ